MELLRQGFSVSIPALMMEQAKRWGWTYGSEGHRPAQRRQGNEGCSTMSPGSSVPPTAQVSSETDSRLALRIQFKEPAFDFSFVRFW